jgi:lysophospholipase L1-like esterase
MTQGFETAKEVTRASLDAGRLKVPVPQGSQKRLLVLVLLQVLFIGCASLMALWVDIPWCGRIGLVVMGVAVIAGGAPWLRRKEVSYRWLEVLAVCCSIAIPLDLWWVYRNAAGIYLEFYYAVLAWFVAAAVIPNCRYTSESGQTFWWKFIAASWFFLGDALWVGAAYLQNQRAAFYLGLVITFALLVTCKWAFVLPRAVEPIVNGSLLLVIGVPLANLVLHPTSVLRLDPNVLSRYSTYEGAKRNRNAFEQWWNYYWNDWLRLKPHIMIEDESAPVRFCLRPGTHGTLVQSQISINRNGFRGPELHDPRQNAYRIVVLGESSTFGLTIGRDDKPWPELLENLIVTRLKTSRPVEVINAGVPKADITDNLHRIARDILPLKAEMVISYHGFNGFCLLSKVMPPPRGKPPPAYQLRPLQLLADTEYRVRLYRYRRSLTAKLFRNPPRFSDVTNTEYAAAYHELIKIAQTNQFHLVLANFSMAANEHSEPDVMDFFRPRFPLLYFQIKANSAHDLLLQQLAEQFPEVRLLNTHPNLDGDEEKFLDLVHLNHTGDTQIAENVFNGIKDILAKDFEKR